MSDRLVNVDHLRMEAERSAGLASQIAAAAADAIEELDSSKQDKLTGVAGEIVGFDAGGNAVAQAAPSGGMTQEEADARYLKLSGGTMTGSLLMGSNDISMLKYLGFGPYDSDFRVSSTFNGFSPVLKSTITPTGMNVSIVAMAFYINGSLGNVRVKTPVENNDAATKKYVDDAIAAAISGAIEEAF